MSEFVVNDRRTFSKDGTKNTQNEEASPKSDDKELEKGDEASSKQSSPETNNANDSSGSAPFSSDEIPQGLPPTLTSLFIGLATSAMVHLGEDNPDGKTPSKKDLPAAKVYIDLLGVLQIKTKGNLDPQEEAILSAFLYDLRMKYVKLTHTE